VLDVVRVDVYSPRTNTWSRGPPLPEPRSRLGAARLSAGRVYALGGHPPGTGYEVATTTVFVLDTRAA